MARKRLDLLQQPFQPRRAGQSKYPRLRHEIVPAARLHRTLQPLASNI
jgi:hypothetical protein